MTNNLYRNLAPVTDVAWTEIELEATRTFKRLLLTNNLKRARRNVAHHYDLSDDLYELFLDADKQYSCAYWTDPAHKTLEQAQLDKKAHIAAKLALKL